MSIRSDLRAPSDEPLRLPVARRRRLRSAGSLALPAAGVAGATAFGIRQLVPDHLGIRTDIVGYPIFANFNINTYFYNYYLIGLFFPIMTAIVFFSLKRALRLAPSGLTDDAAGSSLDTRRSLGGTGRLRSALLGAVFGIEVAISLNAHGFTVLTVSASLAAGATGLVLILARNPPGFGAELSVRERTAAINAVGAPLVVGGLLLVSRATKVDVAATGSTDPRPWLPLWLALLVMAGMIAWVATDLARARREGGLLRLENRMTVGLVGSVLLFLLTAAIPGPVGIDMFHSGESLVPTELLQGGLFPWRDFVFIHGLFQDLIRSAVGIHLFEDTAWGSVAGETLIVTPLYWLGLYALACRLFPRNRPALWLAGLLAVTVVYPYPLLRFVLWPIVLVALARLLDRPTWGRSAAFIILLVAQTVLTPESAYAVVACGATVLAFEAPRRRQSGLWPAGFPRAWRCAVVGSVVGSIFFLYLSANGAAGAFVTGTLGFARGHRFTGGVPVTWGGTPFAVAVVAPVAAVAVTIGYLASRISRRRQLEPHDGVLLAAALMTAMYYPKFLSRADGHAYQAFAVSFPLLMVLAARACDALDRNRAAVRRRAWPVAERVTGVLLLTVLVLEFAPLRTRISNVAAAFHPSAPVVEKQKIGYTTTQAIDRALIDDLGLVLKQFVGTSDTVFDFTNEPALFHYLLDTKPATRFFHVSMAIRQAHQRDLIADLKRHPPRIVIFDEDVLGQPVWDGIPNVVRHYEVGQYLLDTFKPLLSLHNYLLMAQPGDVARFRSEIPPGLHAQPQFDGIEYGIRVCDWGYVPNFLAAHPSGPPIPLSFAGNPDGTLRVEIPPGLSLRDFRWLQVVSDHGFEHGQFALWAGLDLVPNRGITFRSLATSQRSLTIRVGSCPAWHAFATTPLTLQLPRRQGVTAIRLIR